MLRFIACILFVFISFNLKAQTWELGGAVGGAGYIGDLNQLNPAKVSGIAVSAFVKRNFDGYLSAKLNYAFGIISAADSNSSSAQLRARNLSFTTTLFEVSVIGEFNFMKYIPDVSKSIFTPYIYLGVGALNYYPSTVYNGQKYGVRGYETEGESKPYPVTALTIPYGVGVKYNVLGKWTIAADIGYRYTNTDYLDDVSGNYPNKNANSPISAALSDRSGEKTGVYIGAPGSQRGDGNPHDTYFFAQVSLSFTFVTQKCYFER